MKVVSPAATRYRVRVTGRGDTAAEFDCDSAEPILHAGLRAGLNLPYECASGTCGTCKATMLDGAIDCVWPEAPGHKTVKAERREFLMCQSHPTVDATISIAKCVEYRAPERPSPRAVRGTLDRIAKLNRDVMSFVVTLDEALDFDAGQFVLFAVDDVVGARSYSMVNFVPGARTLEFLVKRFPGGKLTTWFFDDAVDGMRVSLFGPLGRATFEPELGQNICCIAGGSGIAGMMAILAHANAIDYFADRGGDVFFGLRTPNDVFFIDDLVKCVAASRGRLRVTVAFSDAVATPELVARYPNVTFAKGFVHDAARATCASLTDTMFYVAGPPPMVDGALRMLLLDAKVPGTQVRYDKFS